MTPFIRASKSFKCAACDHGDWCSYDSDRQQWCCMRVHSSRPAKNGGYLHALNPNERPKFIPKPPPEEPQIDAGALMMEFRNETISEQRAWLRLLSHNLGVSVGSLENIGCAWSMSRKAYAFPMFSGTGQCVGIRLRLRDGRKLSVKGGREGLFMPHGRSTTCYLVEGPTDLAAALTLGLWGIGRPSCRGAVAHTQVTINRLGIQRVVIIGDNDQPGIDGAKSLAAELQVPVASMLLPTKDLREYVRMGGTLDLLKALERQLVWRQPK